MATPKFINPIKSKIMLSCNEATFLIEKSQEDKLSFWENMQLKLHTNMCKVCKAYEQQSLRINSILAKQLGRQKNELSKKEDTTELQELILKKIKETQSKDNLSQ